jgi:hypothetical protein
MSVDFSPLLDPHVQHYSRVARARVAPDILHMQSSVESESCRKDKSALIPSETHVY